MHHVAVSTFDLWDRFWGAEFQPERASLDADGGLFFDDINFKLKQTDILYSNLVDKLFIK